MTRSLFLLTLHGTIISTFVIAHRRLLSDIAAYEKEVAKFKTQLAEVRNAGAAADISKVKLISNQTEESVLALQDTISRATTAQGELHNALKLFPADKDRDGIFAAAKAIYGRSSELGLPVDPKFAPAAGAPAAAAGPAAGAAVEGSNAASAAAAGAGAGAASASASAAATAGEGKESDGAATRGLKAGFQRTFVAVKPDGVQRALTGEIIKRLESKGLKLVGMKFLVPPKALVEKHYEEHKERPFFPSLVKFLSSGPVSALAFEGFDAIKTVRKMAGATDPREAALGTIRGDFGMAMQRNIVHSSDGLPGADRELALWFPEGVVSWTAMADAQLYE